MRQRQAAIHASGQAVIWLGIWSIIKAILAIWLDVIDWEGIVGNIVSDPDFKASLITSFITIAVLAVIMLILHIYLGMSAMKEGKGKHKSIVYVVISMIYLFYIAFVDIFFLNDIIAFTEREAGYGLHNILTSFVFDITLGIALVVIIYNSLKLRKLGSAERGN